VIFREENHQKTEPFEEVTLDCPEGMSGSVIEKMGRRKAEMKDMRVENGTAYLQFEIPTRGLIGYRTEFMMDTRGQGVINTLFLGYRPFIGTIDGSPHGSLIAHETGESNSYGLTAAQERGQLFLGPGVKVYEGMVVGQNAKPEDISVNVCKEKKLSNMRSKGDGVSEGLTTPRIMSLEESLEYLGDDELLEVTPVNLRIRKQYLKEFERKRTSN
jgi:GTP-binding protein